MADEPSRLGSVVGGKYRLDAELGRGGMGAVYLGHHERVAKDFAVKILHPDLAKNKEASARFFKEAQAAGRIGHPAILEVYDVGELDDGAPYMVMELLHGMALSTALRRGRFEIDQAIWVALAVLEALDAAHRAGVIHRDVKPQNIFLTKDADDVRAVKLLDFGIAKFQTSDASALTHTGKIIGSPLYMAPEQARAEVAVDARADVWSVGATLFEMLTGAPAYIAPSAVAVLAKILTEPAPPPSSRRPGIDPALDQLVTRAMASDREDRYPTARAMLDELRQVRENMGVSPDAPPPTFRQVSAAIAAGLASTDAITASVETDGVAGAPAADAEPARARSDSTTGPKRPSDGGARPKRVSDGGARPSSASTDEPEGASVTRHETPTRRSPWMFVALGVIAAAIVVPLALPGWTRRAAVPEPGASAGPAGAPAGASASASAGASAGAGASASAAGAGASAPASAGAGASASAGAGAVAPASASAGAGAPASASASASAGAGAPASAGAGHVKAPVVRPAATCAPGEVRSGGHCCPRGFEWRNGRCDRPMATTF